MGGREFNCEGRGVQLWRGRAHTQVLALQYHPLCPHGGPRILIGKAQQLHPRGIEPRPQPSHSTLCILLLDEATKGCHVPHMRCHLSDL